MPWAVAVTYLRKSPLDRHRLARHRPNVERAIAQVATWRGRRLKLRYAEPAKNNAWLKRRTAAINPSHLAQPGPDPPRRHLVLAT